MFNSSNSSHGLCRQLTLLTTLRQACLGAATNGQAGELEQAVAELRENPYDLATLYNDFAVKYRVRARKTDAACRRCKVTEMTDVIVDRPCVYYLDAQKHDMPRAARACEGAAHRPVMGNAQVWRLCLEMVALGDFNDASYVRQLWDVHLRSTCAACYHMHPQQRGDRDV